MKNWLGYLVLLLFFFGATPFYAVSQSQSLDLPFEFGGTKAKPKKKLPKGDCQFKVMPDLPLQKSNKMLEREIDIIVQKASEFYLGSTPPPIDSLSKAQQAYKELNIRVVGNTIEGRQILKFDEVAFLYVFAQQIKHYPSDVDTKRKAVNTIWLVSKQVCDGTISFDGPVTYGYRKFGRPAIFLQTILPGHVQELFEYSLFRATDEFKHFWEPLYDEAYQSTHGAINTDHVFNLLSILMVYSSWQKDASSRLRYMRAFQRYLERFLSYSYGTADGIKPDGSGFHHWAAHDSYMYAYRVAVEVIDVLGNSSFQIAEEPYKRLRDAVFAQMVFSNDSLVRPLSMTGRNPEKRTVSNRPSVAFELSISGAGVLKMASPDPELLAAYQYLVGEKDHPPTSLASGFFQLNHAAAGVYRTKGWLAVSKGFTNSLWGAEIYSASNRYGRYQSYGTLEIIYPGDVVGGNGFLIGGWNWNHNPGTTTIVLPWDKLQAEKDRLDEHQQKEFVGAHILQNVGSEVLTKTHGSYGMFAMDFQEAAHGGSLDTSGNNNHNETFTFKKSNYFVGDMIVCLGSGISNNDSLHNTVTTLYQRGKVNGQSWVVNGSRVDEPGTFILEDTKDHWVIDGFNTGYYVVSGGGDLQLRDGTQSSPSHQNNARALSTGSIAEDYTLGYIDHGAAPKNGNYEFVCLPNTGIDQMSVFAKLFENSATKPYIVHQQNANAHIVEFRHEGVWGYSLFTSNKKLPETGLIVSNSDPCLVMYKQIEDETILLSVSNPNLGFERRKYSASQSLDIRLEISGHWELSTLCESVVAVASNSEGTVLEFTTKDGLPLEIELLKIVND